MVTLPNRFFTSEERASLEQARGDVLAVLAVGTYKVDRLRIARDRIDSIIARIENEQEIARIEAQEAEIAARYCQDCGHPKGYHATSRHESARGCSMPLDQSGLPTTRGFSHTVRSCGCKVDFSGEEER